MPHPRAEYAADHHYITIRFIVGSVLQQPRLLCGSQQYPQLRCVGLQRCQHSLCQRQDLPGSPCCPRRRDRHLIWRSILPRALCSPIYRQPVLLQPCLWRYHDVVCRFLRLQCQQRMHLRSRGQEDPYYWPDLLNAGTISLEFALMKPEEQPSFWNVQLIFSSHSLHSSFHHLSLLIYCLYLPFWTDVLTLHSLVENIHRRAHVYIGS